MELTTARLVIRPFQVSDITPMYLDALNDHSIIGKTEARHRHWDRESAEVFIRAANSGSSRLYGVFVLSTRKPIGNVRLFEIHPVHRRAELSLLFYDKSEWSKGYATEAVAAVVRHGFDDLGLHRILADYYATNTASARMFEKAGFVQEGVFTDHFAVGGRAFENSVRVAILNRSSV